MRVAICEACCESGVNTYGGVRPRGAAIVTMVLAVVTRSAAHHGDVIVVGIPAVLKGVKLDGHAIGNARNGCVALASSSP